MLSWEFLGSGRGPGNGEELALYRRGPEFSIRVNDSQLMDSCVHGSEDALAELACAKIVGRPEPRVLIGGLGMGFTVAAALRQIPSNGEIIVAEWVPIVVTWNQGPLGHLAGHPLNDSRVTVREADVAHLLRTDEAAYDAILLDVDNGPKGLTHKTNNWLYAQIGLETAHRALRPKGILAVWSAMPNKAFANRFRRTGFAVDEVHVRARGAQGGPHHVIWLGERGA